MRAALLAVAWVPAACAMLASDGAGDRDLPATGVGPFRRLEGTEMASAPPFVLSDRNARYREPCAVALDGMAAPAAVALFAVASRERGGDAIVRTRADDGRTFVGGPSDGGRTPRVALEATEAWEGGSVGGPSVVRRDGEWLLYYSGAGGIGLARSADGVSFRKHDGPVLARDATVAWETSPPRAPAVAIFPGGRLHIFYATGAVIMEATSDDGATFVRVDPDPRTEIIEPVLLADSSPVRDGVPPFDSAGVSDPSVHVRMTAAGRLHVRVLYTGYDRGGSSAIGFAARYGDRGLLTRQVTPAFAVGKREAAPTLLERAAASLLYVQMDQTEGGVTFPAIAAAVGPATEHLGAPAAPPPDP